MDDGFPAAASTRPSISVIIITLNEEQRLEQTLRSVTWANQIVIVDSGSTDRTEEIARRFTDCFHIVPWEGFGPHKQRALDLATGDWVLSIDADEVVSPELRRSIEEAVRHPRGAAGFRMELQTEFLGAWLGSRGWHRQWKMRLFRRDLARFETNVVHEGVILDGPVGRLDGVLLHYYFRGLEHQIDKLNRYTSLMAESLFANGKRSGIVKPVVRGAGNFLKSFVLQGRFLYGGAGFMAAALSGIYNFLKYAKLWELQRSRTAEPSRVAVRGAPDCESG